MSIYMAMIDMATYIVTVKKHNRKHDPTNKQVGECFLHVVCTDSTGHHHSFVVYSTDNLPLIEVAKHFERLGFTISRIEQAREEFIPPLIEETK